MPFNVTEIWEKIVLHKSKDNIKRLLMSISKPVALLLLLQLKEEKNPLYFPFCSFS